MPRGRDCWAPSWSLAVVMLVYVYVYVYIYVCICMFICMDVHVYMARHTYISWLYLLKEPRSKDVAVAVGIPSIQILVSNIILSKNY